MTLMPLSSACLQRVRQRGAVDRRDHQHLGALGDHVLDLGELVRDIVLGILQVGAVAALLQHLDDVVAVVDPARGGFGRHGDADARLALCKRLAGGGRGDKARQREREKRGQFGHVSLPFMLNLRV